MEWRFSVRGRKCHRSWSRSDRGSPPASRNCCSSVTRLGPTSPRQLHPSIVTRWKAGRTRWWWTRPVGRTYTVLLHEGREEGARAPIDFIVQALHAGHSTLLALTVEGNLMKNCRKYVRRCTSCRISNKLGPVLGLQLHTRIAGKLSC